MILKTYGHATLSFELDEKPFLITDPWLIGSCYWRSWWLQHYPNQKDLAVLKNADTIFLTHEHWDHAHFPTLKKLIILSFGFSIKPNFPSNLLNLEKLTSFIDLLICSLLTSNPLIPFKYLTIL